MSNGFLALEGNRSNGAFSPDGSSWSGGSSPATLDESWVGVAYGAGLWVVISLTSGTDYWYSSNGGVSWTLGTLPWSENWATFKYSNGYFVLGGVEHVLTSTDGLTWDYNTTPFTPKLWIADYNGSVFIALSNDTSGNALYSSDGITWSATTIATYSWIDVAWGNGTWVAIMQTLGDTATSPDGITWTHNAGVMATNPNNGVYFGDGVFLTASIPYAEVYSSSDGVTWATTITPFVGQLAAFGDGLFVLFGGSGDVASAPASTLVWSSVTSLPDGSSYWVAGHGVGPSLQIIMMP